jgi:D-alanyl-lipoteichoic acid acyltransferase DltB (MBOAT superfamily)
MLFMPTVVALYFLLGLTARRWLLLVASYYFYCVWSVKLASLLVFSTFLDYTVARLIASSESPGRRKLFVGLSLAGNLGMLGLFKYLGFFTEIANSLITVLGMNELTVHRLVLPMGISFYTFQTLSYTIDVYRGHTQACKSIVDVALYVAFFPQLVAGPIMRSDTLLPQFRELHLPNLDRIRSGALLIVWGMLKKIYLADPMGRIVDEVYTVPDEYGGAALLLATYAFAIQIYCDFSAYSDIARGAGRCLGFEVMVNFRTPYISSTLRDFWRRWHISLSTWLRDYLYIPLGGSKGSTLRTYINLMMTMLLGGLWHGASWNFVIWGGLHGGFLAGERILKLDELDTGKMTLVGRVIRTILIFHFVCLCWIFFRAETLAISTAIVWRIVQWVPGAMVSLAPLWTLLFMVAFSFWLEKDNRILTWMESRPTLARWFIYASMLLLASLLARQDSPDFIYFQF